MYHIDDEMVEEIKEGAERVARSGSFVLGRETKEFEDMCDRELFNSSEHKTLLVSNGTCAIELALRALSPFAKGKLVLMPAMTVPMVKWAIEKAGFVTVPMDIDPLSQCMDVEKVMDFIDGGILHENVFAVVMVYTGGLIPARMKELVVFLKERGIRLVEDISHAYASESFLDGAGFFAGENGDAVCGSMFATKVLSVGEGGIVRFNDDSAYRYGKLIRNQGRADNGVQCLDDCYNYRASEYTASVAKVKLKYLDREIGYRRTIVEDVYLPYFAKHVGYRLPQDTLNVSHSYYKFIVQFAGADEYEAKIAALGAPVAGAVHRTTLFPNRFMQAEEVAKNHLCPPLNTLDNARKFITIFEQVCA